MFSDGVCKLRKKARHGRSVSCGAYEERREKRENEFVKKTKMCLCLRCRKEYESDHVGLCSRCRQYANSVD